MPVLNSQNQQRMIKSKNEQIKKIKSPYNQGQLKNSNKLAKLGATPISQEMTHTQVPSRQGRDIMRSQQANRQQTQLKSTEPPFKMHRHAAAKQKKILSQ